MTQARNLSLFADNVSSSGTVAVAGINATGTPSSTTYLRGDGTWATVSGGVTSFSAGTTGFTPSTATTGAVTLAGTLITSNGGTGLSSYTAGDLSYYASGTALSKLAIGTAGQILTSSGTAPQWSTLSGVAVTTFSAGTTGFTPSTATTGAVTLAGTLATTNGGTGLTSFTSGGVVYASSTSALATGSALTFDGTNLTLGNNPISFGAGYTNLTVSGSSGGALYVANTANTGQGFFGVNSSTLQIGSQTNIPVVFYQNNTEGMRLTSTGLGIGTSSPAYKLDVSGYIRGIVSNASVGNASSMQLTQNGSGDAAISFLIGSTTEWLAGVDNSNSDSFKINNITGGGAFNNVGITLTTAGNLGLGVTPSAWSTVTALQIKNASVYGYSTSEAGVNQNAYYGSGNWRYISAVAATAYRQISGAHSWHISSGAPVADGAISFTQAMSLLANGTLCVNTTSSTPGSGAIQISAKNSVALGTNDTAAYYSVANYYNSSFAGGLYVTSGATALIASSDYRLKNITGPITTSGEYIDSLKPVEGTWKADGSTFVGLIAHEAQEASRTLIATGTKDGKEMQGMTYSSPEMIANLIAEIQSLRKRILTLENK